MVLLIWLHCQLFSRRLDKEIHKPHERPGFPESNIKTTETERDAQYTKKTIRNIIRPLWWYLSSHSSLQHHILPPKPLYHTKNRVCLYYLRLLLKFYERKSPYEMQGDNHHCHKGYTIHTTCFNKREYVMNVCDCIEKFHWLNYKMRARIMIILESWLWAKMWGMELTTFFRNPGLCGNRAFREQKTQPFLPTWRIGYSLWVTITWSCRKHF